MRARKVLEQEYDELEQQLKPHMNHSFSSEYLSFISTKMFKTIWGQRRREENAPRYLLVEYHPFLHRESDDPRIQTCSK